MSNGRYNATDPSLNDGDQWPARLDAKGRMQAVGSKLETATATITSGGTTSGAVDVNGKIIVGIDLGATLTGTALSIQNAADGTNYRATYDTAGAAVSWTVAGNRFLKFDPPLLGYRSIKLVSGSAEGADRTLTVVMAP
jgi:YD repeat-containing protein